MPSAPRSTPNPQYTDALAGLGLALYNLEDYSAAVPALDQAVSSLEGALGRDAPALRGAPRSAGAEPLRSRALRGRGRGVRAGRPGAAGSSGAADRARLGVSQGRAPGRCAGGVPARARSGPRLAPTPPAGSRPRVEVRRQARSAGGRRRSTGSIRRGTSWPSPGWPRSRPRSAITWPRSSVVTGQPDTVQPSHGTVVAHVEVVARERLVDGGIDQHEVGVAARRDDTLPRMEPEDPRGVRRGDGGEALERHPALDDPSVNAIPRRASAPRLPPVTSSIVRPRSFSARLVGILVGRQGRDAAVHEARARAPRGPPAA